ncbi:MAG: sulfurtransferase [Candidatus Latescibacterota bacterium]|nr:MAG: sulfurtransferase [Candidatus Latescibacterota bacterium]
MAEYADSQVLVSTEWTDLHRNDPNLVIVEVDKDIEAYKNGHIPGAISWNWQTDLSDELRRDILGPSDLEALLSRSGISNNTTIVLFGDEHNWLAGWAFWQLKIYGHRDVRMLNGGREKWLAEGRELTKVVPTPKPSKYRSRTLNQDLRAFLPLVKVAVKSQEFAIVDARSTEEFTGLAPAPMGSTQISQKAGHIPGAKSIPWDLVRETDGTLKKADAIRNLFESKGVTPDKEVITYSRVGERSSHTWFVLKHLLGYPVVKNYDGSWAEWGNLVGVAIEQGEEKPPRFARVESGAGR